MQTEQGLNEKRRPNQIYPKLHCISALEAAAQAKREAADKQAELDALTRVLLFWMSGDMILFQAADRAREVAKLHEAEAKRQALERTKSRKKRQLEAAERELKARYKCLIFLSWQNLWCREEMQAQAQRALESLKASELGIRLHYKLV